MRKEEPYLISLQRSPEPLNEIWVYENTSGEMKGVNGMSANSVEEAAYNVARYIRVDGRGSDAHIYRIESESFDAIMGIPLRRVLEEVVEKHNTIVETQRALIGDRRK